MMLTITIRIFAFLLFLLLLTSAFLQLNDPDPILWTTYYVICAIVPLLLVMKRFNAVVFWVGVVASLVIMGIYAPGTLEYLRHAAQEPLMQSMNPAKPYIEEARECIGGFITLCILLLCRFLWLRLNKSAVAQ
ncbi:MAG TPA: transmembrane 220 family protein [Cellvibrio sp.]|nr:transmembrane 220 family protein [Cellvibrio sp.]